MRLSTAGVPEDAAPRVVWLIVRLLLWLLLYSALELILGGALLGLTRRLSGPYVLLSTTTTVLAAVIAGVVMLRFLDQRPAADLGFPLNASVPKMFGAGLLIGAGALLLAGALMALPGWLRFRSQDGSAVGWLVIVIRDLGLFGVAAAAEEAVYRGYAFQTLVRGAGAPVAVIASSALFAWAHYNNPSIGVFGLINIFLAGVMLAAAYLVTRSLWFATAIHLGWNWSMGTLVDLPVSGLEYFDTPLYEPTLRGPAWFTGGEFGPEGGLTGTLGFLAASAAVWWYARRRRTTVESA